jgi:6-phosphogluconolactonase
MTQTYDGTPLANRTVLADSAALARHAAEVLVDEAARVPGRFALSLSGGSTPKLLYELLATPEFRDRMPWERVHLFWGDERFVPHDHADSNYRMTREAMLDHLPIPPENIHAVPTDTTPADGAARYDRTLRVFYGRENLDASRPLFDVTLLGLGEDGHTASLFPGTPALDESLAWVTPVTTHVAQPRVTLTYPAIASSGTVLFLAAGAGKRAILQRVWQGDHALPSARVRAVGRTLWVVDRAAAGA